MKMEKLLCRTAKNVMEKKLHEEFMELRKKRPSVKGRWFTLHGGQILNNLYLEMEFKFSDQWFG